MKNTVFTEKHIALGAKMAPFAGYNMPIQYTGINEEHATVREGVGVFDVSHMGEIWVTGENALPFLQYVSTNDVPVLFPGKAQYTCFPNGKGGIVDDFIVYCFSTEKYLLAVNAANIEKDWNHLCSIAPKFGIEPGKDLVNASDATCQLAIQGPKAMEVMQKLCKEDVMSMEYYTFKQIEVAGIPDAIFSTTGYTGSGGCEVYVPNSEGDKLWKAVFEAGEPFGIKPIGLGARDTLRLEMGFCLYGHEINDTTSPLEGGLAWITKFTDTKNFINKENLLQQKAEGLTRKVVGFEMIDRGIPREGYDVVDADDNNIGHVCSGTQGPSVKKAIGTAIVSKAFTKTGSEIYIKIRDKKLKAVVVKMPFYKGE